VDAGRIEALTFVREGIDQGLAWVEKHAAPRVIDALVPHIAESVVPRLVDATMPLLRSRVLPVVIKDLTDDPLLRTLVLEQSRGAVSQATDQLRNATAHADDRVENLFHGLVHRHRDQ
jgi:hypothetical protein